MSHIMNASVEKFPWNEIDLLIHATLEEDLNRSGDITSQWCVPEGKKGTAMFIAKDRGILAGLPIVNRIFQIVDPTLLFTSLKQDGDPVEKGETFARVEGELSHILTVERTALNILQQLSGTATITNQYMQLIRHTKASLLDTRKTLPRMRWLQKYAVRMGGGLNHRFGLYDMILIKDNHIDAAGGISNVLNLCFLRMEESGNKIPIEIETKNLEDVKEALNFPVDRIMLDNMSPDLMCKAVQLINGKSEIEASGNVSLDTVKTIAETGVNFISVGALTHSVKAFDISLLLDVIN